MMRAAARGDSRPADMRSALSVAVAEAAVHISAHLRGYVPGWKTGDSSPYTPLAWWRSILQDRTVASRRYGVSVPIMDRVADFMAEAVGLKDYVPVCSLPSRSACRGTWRPCGAALEGISGGVRLLGLHSVAVCLPGGFQHACCSRRCARGCEQNLWGDVMVRSVGLGRCPWVDGCGRCPPCCPARPI